MGISDNSHSVELAALLARSYEGELIGCAMYAEMASVGIAPDTTSIELLHRIETLTAEALEPTVLAFEVEVDRDGAAEAGRLLAQKLRNETWKSMWQNIIGLADGYLRDFERLEILLCSLGIEVGRQVVEHELALMEYAQREIRDDANSMAPLLGYLEKYS